MLATYRRWLHAQWPAGTVEPLPQSGPGGTTAIPGVRIIGDLAGTPLLKRSAAGGASAITYILSEPGFKASSDPGVLDVAIVGAGAAGIAAAIAAQRAGLRCAVYDATRAFATIADIPGRMEIHAYPTGGDPESALLITASKKADLLAELERQRVAAGIEPIVSRIDHIEQAGHECRLHHADTSVTRAQRVLVAIGRRGIHRTLDCPGGHLDKVQTRLYDPQEFARKQVLVVGGGNAAVEAAVALVSCGAKVTLSHRQAALSKPSRENLDKLRALERDPSADVHIEAPVSPYVTTATMRTMKSPEGPGSIQILPATTVARIEPATVTLLDADQRQTTIPNHAVFAMIGREGPAGFFRRSHLPLRGDWDAVTWAWLGLSLLLCFLVLHWKGSYPEFPFQQVVARYQAFPYDVPRMIDAIGGAIGQRAGTEPHLLYTIKLALGRPSFYFTFVYALVVSIFGIRRIRRTRTRYVLWQTLSLMFVQWFFLCLLPEILLPWAGRNGYFEPGERMRVLADALFERLDGFRGHERAYWRAYGLIVPFPLNVANVFADRPMWLWVEISALQLAAILPLMVRRWGKGGYCGWICPWGAVAETVGDRQREKMPHGPQWNRLNMLGQGVLALSVALLGLHLWGWANGASSWAAIGFGWFYNAVPYLNYAWLVDVMMAGVFGLGLCFFLSGRAFCRFACPLGALMHIYARGTRFRIFPDKALCTSCTECTRVCHAGVDVMNFANKDLPVVDPECVRCSACVAECPTGALTLGFRRPSGEVVLDKMDASLVQTREARLAP
ncbi:MAG: NAD(P)-binding domain-containing protein [Acidobacteria bacterium]|nr:NAD(P)-binding domain-containing protein [Acidobacteriota bacterium]